MLTDRNYPEGIVNSAISKARAIPRSVAIRKVVREDTSKRRPVFCGLLGSPSPICLNHDPETLAQYDKSRPVNERSVSRAPTHSL